MGVTCTISKAVAIGAMGLAIGLVDRSLRPLTVTMESTPAPLTPGTPGTPTPPSTPATTTGATGSTAAGSTPAPAVTTPSADPHAGAKGMIGLAEAKAIYDSGGAEWIDARPADEYALDRIGQAYHITPDAFFGGKVPDVLSVMDRSKKVVVYCGGGSCDSSLLVALNLRDLGFGDVVVMKDGWTGWTAAKHPTANHPEGTP
jgi:rhodanese-related sulfurtransferase